jgi:hypothetical protein
MVEKRTYKPKSAKGTATASLRHATRTSARRRKASALETSSTRAVMPKGSWTRGGAVLKEAAAAGYLGGQKTERIGGRVTRKLLAAAKAKSGLTSQTELLEYALSKVAVEDDYAAILLSMKGSIPDDVEL